jgi:xanthine dehydrogenase accessory factor
MKETPAFALVRGANDVASAVALALARAGFAVLLVETPTPVISRRGQSFADAAFDGTATLEGVTARLIDDPSAWARRATAGLIAMTVLPLEDFAPYFEASVWIDARMRKRTTPEDQRGRARLVIGLGTNFIAGGNVDLAIETAWGQALGKVIEAGPTSAFAGEPKPIGGYGRERYVYAPAAGVFRTEHRIGQAVAEGEILARIDELPIAAPKSGILRGLIHDGVRIERGTKCVEVVPAGTNVFGVGERPAAIASGVMAALRLWGGLPAV